MSSDRSATLAGFFFGVALTVWLNVSPWSDATRYRVAIKECEKTLPRDQHCKVIGVPIIETKQP